MRFFDKIKKEQHIDENIVLLNKVNVVFSDFEYTISNIKGKNGERSPKRKMILKVINEYQDIFSALVKNDVNKLINTIFVRLRISLHDKFIWEIDSIKENFSELVNSEIDKLEAKLIDLLFNKTIDFDLNTLALNMKELENEKEI